MLPEKLVRYLPPKLHMPHYPNGRNPSEIQFLDASYQRQFLSATLVEGSEQGSDTILSCSYSDFRLSGFAWLFELGHGRCIYTIK